LRNQDSLATILLCGRLGGGEVTPLKASEFWSLCDRVDSPGALLGASAGELGDTLDIDAVRAAAVVRLLGRGTAVAFELERLTSSGIATLTPFDDGYPHRLVERLDQHAPPVLHTAGPVALLGMRNVAIVGDAVDGAITDDASRLAAEAAERLVASGVAVVSGAGTGLTRTAMDATFAVEGTVIAVLADSLTNTLRRPEIRRAVLAGHAVMCTPYGPDTLLRAATERGRRKLIHALADVTFVVTADPEGGAFAAAVEALEGDVGRVAVWRGPGEGPGNAALVERGAVPVTSLEDLPGLVPGEADKPDGPPPDMTGAAPADTDAPEPPTSTALPVSDQASLFDPPGP
jgi:predicted Rossmann fold nucleotide-binding protein DprA/Smf involved in DNA uptake